MTFLKFQLAACTELHATLPHCAEVDFQGGEPQQGQDQGLTFQQYFVKKFFGTEF